MSQPRTAAEILDRDFLETRAKILELAASLDRLDRATSREQLEDDPRFDLIRKALETLQNSGPRRAEDIQLLFSDPYDPGWRQQLPVAPRSS